MSQIFAFEISFGLNHLYYYIFICDIVIQEHQCASVHHRIIVLHWQNFNYINVYFAIIHALFYIHIGSLYIFLTLGFCSHVVVAFVVLPLNILK